MATMDLAETAPEAGLVEVLLLSSRKGDRRAAAPRRAWRQAARELIPHFLVQPLHRSLGPSIETP